MTTASELAAKAGELAASFDENFLDLGHVLRALQDIDTDEFTRTVQRSGISSRKAYYLTTIDRAFEKIPAPKDRLKKIGWTKLKTLTSHISKANYTTLLKVAEKNTDKELEAILRGEEVTEKKKAILMYLSRDENAEFERALLMFGAKRSGRGMPNREEAVMTMTRWVLEQREA